MWSEGGTLKNRYPRIYALESSKSITVGMKVAQPSLAFSFPRAPRGCVEQEQFDEIVALVNDVILAPIWTLESSGDFSVASVRKLIDDTSIPVVDYKTRWIKYVPIKVLLMRGKVKSESLPTRFNISRRCGLCPGRPFKDLIAPPPTSLGDLYIHVNSRIRADEANNANRLRDTKE
ncbi:hypothetical protein Tco_1408638 [Tanacetum coccineum]